MTSTHDGLTKGFIERVYNNKLDWANEEVTLQIIAVNKTGECPDTGWDCTGIILSDGKQYILGVWITKNIPKSIIQELIRKFYVIEVHVLSINWSKSPPNRSMEIPTLVFNSLRIKEKLNDPIGSPSSLRTFSLMHSHNLMDSTI